MTLDRLAKWRPAEDLPAITGAAAAFLSVAGAKVILHSPMWCAAITEMRLEAWGIPCEWLFSTFIEDDDLFFGGEEALRQTLLEARVAKGDALLGVAVNCAPGLIGDDVRGICTAFAPGVLVAVAEAGGFTGEFDDGYGKAFLAVLEALRPGPCPPTPETVNLIGFSPLEEHAAENLAEIKRQLFRRGIEVHLTFGVPGTTVESIRKAGRAALNVVLHEGRGEAIAAWFQERLGQPSIFAPLSDAANKKSGQLDAIEAALRMEKRR